MSTTSNACDTKHTTAGQLRLSVVLVSFNTRELTLECLKSLGTELDLSIDEIIVVDNASKDKSVEAIQATFGAAVQVIPLPQNVGFGAANNVAFEVARGENILLLNTDTIVQSGALGEMMRTLESRPDVGAVGCRLENPDGSLQKSCWSFPSPVRAWCEALGINRLGLVADWHRWDHAKEQDVDFVIGAVLMVRSAVLELVGGFDERFFLYSEEADWQKRMHESGWKIAFNPTRSVIHLGGASGSSLGDRQLVEFCRSTARFIRKYHGATGLCCFRAAVIMGTGVRWLIALCRSALGQDCRSREILLRKTMLWWIGLGPREGIKEMVVQTATKPQ